MYILKRKEDTVPGLSNYKIEYIKTDTHILESRWDTVSAGIKTSTHILEKKKLTILVKVKQIKQDLQSKA